MGRYFFVVLACAGFGLVGGAAARAGEHHHRHHRRDCSTCMDCGAPHHRCDGCGVIREPEAPTPEGAVARGRRLFGELTPRCTVCHAVAGQGNPKGALDDVGSRWPVAALKRWLREPAAMAREHGKDRKPAMVPYPELSDDELEDMTAYLASLRTP
jgi:mono/diheme cytochrome c family protein